jgi:hypothetical protein
MEWQDISTAPKDGTAVLAYDPSWYDVPYPMKMNRFGRWVHWFDDHGPFHPTHWQPLPEPPEN